MDNEEYKDIKDYDHSVGFVCGCNATQDYDKDNKPKGSYYIDVWCEEHDPSITKEVENE